MGVEAKSRKGGQNNQGGAKLIFIAHIYLGEGKALRINKVVHQSDIARWRPGIQCLTLW
jgi:hypothetical protein